MPSQTLSVYANIRGVGIRVRASNAEVLEHFRHDFYYFLKEPGPIDLEVTLTESGMGQERWRVLCRTKQSTLYFSPDGEKRVCFFSSVWVKYRYRDGVCLISGTETNTLYEALYFVVLSYVGEQLDAKGKHRLHGLALASGESSVVVMARSGGGKSTLAQYLLGKEGIEILSDDTPVVTHDNGLEAFPQRIALKEKPQIPDLFIRRFQRYFHGKKYVIGAEYFQSQVRDRAKIDKLVLLTRNENTEAPTLVRVNRLHGLWPLFKWLVVGYEIPQIWELYLRANFEDFPRKLRTLRSRVCMAGRVWAKAEFYELNSGRDPKVAAEALERFLKPESVTA